MGLVFILSQRCVFEIIVFSHQDEINKYQEMDYCVIAMPNSSFSFRLEKKGLAVQKFIQFDPRVLCQSWTTWCCCYCSS